MKKTIQGLFLTTSLLLTTHAFAIEGLTVSVQCTNVILSWPCLDDGSEQFIIQYRPTLQATDSWQTLETSLPAVYGTNQMWYTNYGVVLNPVNCDGGMEEMMVEGGGGMMLSSSQPAVPLATPNGGGDSVPVKLYPTGFDFSNFTITVPGTAGILSGSQFMAEDEDGPPDPGGGDETPSGDTNSVPPDVGFYRVVRVGPHLMGITNGQVLSGVVQIPVEIGGAQDGQLANVTLTENDSPIGNSIHSAPFELPVPIMTLDTTRMTNGVHQIAAIASWDIPLDTNDEGGGNYEYDCPPITVTVSNEISFPGWFDTFGELGDTLLISAVSAHTNVDYDIDIFGANAGYIGTISGHSDDGNIYGYWDLIGPPPDSIVYTNEPWFQFEISTPYIDPPTPKTYKQVDPWPGNGGFVMACQHAWDSTIDSDLLYGEYGQFLSGAIGSSFPVGPTPAGGEPFAIHLESLTVDSGPDWHTLRTYLYNSISRNFVYMGHGGPNGIGHDQSTTNHSIRASEIGNILHTIPAGQTNRHAFRFVFIDGCSTAAGSLCASFGIRHDENVQQIDYINASMRPSAFVGWSAVKFINFLSGAAVNYDHINYINDVQKEMVVDGRGIHDAVINAANYPDVHAFINTSELKVYGYWDLSFTAFNN
ncbi:MAG TPA: hypothetical protein VG938_09070 [Verrucomicrobiae bacterium]|jgi:hypothetical protein|nr:hypothetical protein [Verrucomicrobiae bacterium]